MILPTNPKDIQRINDAIKEVEVQLYTKELASQKIKDIFDALVEDQIDISKSMFNKLASCYHKQDFNERQNKAADFEDFYEGTMQKSSIRTP